MVRKFFGRSALSTLLITLAFGTQAYAADSPLAVVTAPTFARVSFASAMAVPAPMAFAAATANDEKAVDVQLPAAPVKAPVFAGTRPRVLPALYASLAALNMMDALTTRTGLQHGAVEANPVMKGVVGNTPAMFAVKAASTAFTIWMSERLWKKNRGAAIMTMVAMNAATGFIVMHNRSVINQVR